MEKSNATYQEQIVPDQTSRCSRGSWRFRRELNSLETWSPHNVSEGKGKVRSWKGITLYDRAGWDPLAGEQLCRGGPEDPGDKKLNMTQQRGLAAKKFSGILGHMR